MTIRSVISFVVLFSSSLLFSNPILINTPQEHTAALASNKPIIILYTNPITCPPCRIMKPDYYKVSNMYSDIDFYILDTTVVAMKPLLKQIAVQSVPLLVFSYKQRTLIRHKGRLTETELKRKIEAFKNEIIASLSQK